MEAQACNDASCFPPARVPFSLALKVVSAGTPVQPANAEVFGGTAGGASGGETGATTAAAPPAGNAGGSRAHYPRLDRYVPAEEFVRWLQSGSPAPSGAAGFTSLLLAGNWLLALPLIFLGGLALNLTPCVYPLIPITVGFFGSQSGRSRDACWRWRGTCWDGPDVSPSEWWPPSRGSVRQPTAKPRPGRLCPGDGGAGTLDVRAVGDPPAVGLTSRVSGRTGSPAPVDGLLVGSWPHYVVRLYRPAAGGWHPEARHSFAIFFVSARPRPSYLILAYSGLIRSCRAPASG